MIHNLSGSGQSLNFKVLGGSAEPANPGENTIWVSTGVQITGWVFASGEPESPAEGLLWFRLGTAAKADFNALKKNNITLYPHACMQYVGGAWVSKTAKTYQGGEWKIWWEQLYNYGDQFTALTGGWKDMAYSNNTSVEFKSDRILITGAAGSGTELAATINKLDLSGYKKLGVELNTTKLIESVGVSGVKLTSSNNGSISSIDAVTLAQAGNNTLGSQIIECDISSVSEAYITVFAYRTIAEFTAVWLER